MSWFWKFSCTLAIVLASFGYFVHRPIPADVPNQIHFQVLVDYLSAVESAAYLSELLGFSNRWWSYPGNIDIPIPIPQPKDVEIEYTTFGGVDSMVVVSEEFKSRSAPGPAMIFFHGGGWVFGNLNTYKSVFIQAAKETGFLVVAPEYRKAPHHPFPIPYEDCRNTTIDFLKRSKEFNVDPNKIAIVGDSAGGNLAMAITLELLKLHKIDSDIKSPAMTGLIYPVLQMANFRLPSYQQNEEFTFYRALIPKFWLAYIGLNDRLDLADIIAVNGHVRSAMKEKVKLVDYTALPKKSLARGFNSTKIPLTPEQQKLLDDKTLSFLERSYMDTRIAPLMASDQELLEMPPTHVLVCEYDSLRDDGILVYNRMKDLKKTVSLQHLPDSLHASLNLGALFPNIYYGEQNRIFFKAVRDYLK